MLSGLSMSFFFIFGLSVICMFVTYLGENSKKRDFNLKLFTCMAIVSILLAGLMRDLGACNVL